MSSSNSKEDHFLHATVSLVSYLALGCFLLLLFNESITDYDLACIFAQAISFSVTCLITDEIYDLLDKESKIEIKIEITVLRIQEFISLPCILFLLVYLLTSDAIIACNVFIPFIFGFFHVQSD